MERLLFYDTTLRDGTQQVGVTASLEDKLRILERLDRFGMDYVEGGWPGSNPKDLELFRRARTVHLRHARLAAFGSTRRPGGSAERDDNVRALVEAETPTVTVFGKSWDLHVREALATTLEENLAMIADTVAHLKAQGREVIYDAEHFFDGWAANAEYALATLRAAHGAGADWIVLCDTNGGSLPEHVAAGTRSAAGAAPGAALGIHTHDDGGLGVANSMAAVAAGARQIQGTVNGYGERCGNANLCTLLANLVLKLGHQCTAADSMGELTALSLFVSEVANVPPAPGAPFVGPNAFAHKGGIHVSAVSRNPRCYEHVDPLRVGNSRQVVVSELSGGANLAYKERELGLDGLGPAERRRLLERVKQLEFEGYEFEAAEASLALLARKVLRPYEPFFVLEGFHVSTRRGAGEAPYAEATVRVRVGDRRLHTAADAEGPVGALDAALRKALEGPYPELREMHLTDYRVRVIDGARGTGSKVRVLIETRSPAADWLTVGASANIIEASWQALTDSVEYGLLLHRGGVGNVSPQPAGAARPAGTAGA